jgi:hypothetical protein
MKKRTLAPAVAAAWAALMVLPVPSGAERIPGKLMEPGGNVGIDRPVDSDPWVPDATLPTGTVTSSGGRSGHSVDRPTDGRLLDTRQPMDRARITWYLRILRFLRVFPGGGVIR